jgi:hypothetical protein
VLLMLIVMLALILIELVRLAKPISLKIEMENVLLPSQVAKIILLPLV